MKKITFLIIIVLFTFFNNCMIGSSSHNPDDAINVDKMCDEIEIKLRNPSLKNYEIGVLSFVDLNKLDKIDPLGRYLQERVSYGLFKRGFRIVELRNSKEIYFEEGKGEFNLSRFKKNLKQDSISNIKSIVLGTYVEAGEMIYVNAKLIEIKNSLVRSSAELKFKKGKFLEYLYDYKTKKKNNNKINTKEVLERFEVY